MKSVVVAALLLFTATAAFSESAAWYLVVAPNFNNGIPMRSWRIYRAFDSAADCERGRDEYIKRFAFGGITEKEIREATICLPLDYFKAAPPKPA